MLAVLGNWGSLIHQPSNMFGCKKESKELEMESRGNDEKVKFVGLRKKWDEERKLVGPRYM